MQLDPKKVIPTPGYVLIQPVKTEEKTTGGIYLPTTNDDKQHIGTVLAVGASVWESGVKEISSPVKVGDTVIMKKWGGNEVKQRFGSKEEYQIVEFKDILAVIK